LGNPPHAQLAQDDEGEGLLSLPLITVKVCLRINPYFSSTYDNFISPGPCMTG